MITMHSFFFNGTAPPEIYTLSLHDALRSYDNPNALRDYFRDIGRMVLAAEGRKNHTTNITKIVDRKSGSAGMPRPISYAVFCLKKKNNGQAHAERGLEEKRTGVSLKQQR